MPLDGLTYEYGRTGDSYIESLGQQSAARAWAVNKIKDRADNAILFAYAEDTTNGFYRIARIDYTANAAQGLSAAYVIEFFWQTKPSNQMDSGYIAGAKAKEVTRLDRIDVSHGTTFGDFNADGKTDTVYYTGAGTFRTRLSRGTAFTSEIAGPSIAPYGPLWVVFDWDGDGYDDLLVRHTSSATWHLMRSTGEALSAPAATGVAAGNAFFTVSDINGDGLTDLANAASGVWRHRMHTGSYPDLLQTVTDGYGNPLSFAYTPISQGAYTKHAGASFPEQDYQGSLYVLSSLTASNGIGGTYTNTFSYDGARVHLQGRGFAGIYHCVGRRKSRSSPVTPRSRSPARWATAGSATSTRRRLPV